MDIIRLLQDFNINYVTEGHKHCRPGWVNMSCPFCTGNEGFHLGYNTDGDYFYCWRCGGKSLKYGLIKLLNMREPEVVSIISQYGGKSFNKTKEHKEKIKIKPHKYPTNTTELLPKHITYLENRNFNAEKLVKIWSLKGTDLYSILDKINYSRRVIAPIYWNGEEVSFQGRDITNKHPMKYLACPMSREIMHHQHILYGLQKHWHTTGILTEGVTDVWRLGEKSCACFGIEYTNQQLRVIAKSFDKGFIIFDDDPQAIEQANKLIHSLRFRYNKVWERIDIKGDPGGMSQDDADYLVRNLLKKYI